MKAIHMTGTGPANEVLQLVETPEPEITTPTQIKVQLRAAGVNPIDTKLRGRGVFYADAYPAILGCDGAGIVTATGRDTKRFRPGDAVWFCHGGLGGAPGNYAEFTVLDESEAEAKPAALGFEEAAALPLVLITAWEALFDRARLVENQTVLVHAGAGGVGHVAIQLAKSAGARVATTVSTPEKQAVVQQLGADKIILYRDHDFVDAIMEWTGGHGVDVILDSLGGETFRKSLSAASVYGQVVTLLDPGNDVDWKEARNRNLGIHFTLMLTPMLQNLREARRHQGTILARCAALIADGKLKPLVSHVLPLEDAARAHQLIEAGHVQGKIVLRM
ncbi:MAG: zinc-dependent alcohol dehydrogenase family protein [Gammaproteobacteria bacterium]|nr:MAG: zinc-dependent alcohol dehydrogenase family protein [Gammaproteobacteria bacterium]